MTRAERSTERVRARGLRRLIPLLAIPVLFLSMSCVWVTQPVAHQPEQVFPNETFFTQIDGSIDMTGVSKPVQVGIAVKLPDGMHLDSLIARVWKVGDPGTVQRGVEIDRDPSFESYMNGNYPPGVGWGWYGYYSPEMYNPPDPAVFVCSLAIHVDPTVAWGGYELRYGCQGKDASATTSDTLLVPKAWEDSTSSTLWVGLAPPHLVAPLNQDTVMQPLGARPEFTWNELRGSPDAYGVEIDDDQGMSAPEYWINGTDTLMVPSSDLPEGQWFWHARGAISPQMGPWSETWETNIDVTAPDKPALVYPAWSDTVNTPTPLFDWTNPAPDVRHFTMWLYDSTRGGPVDGFPLVIDQAKGEDKSSYQLPDPPLEEGKFAWKVEAQDYALNSLGPCDERWFYLDVTPPAVPAPESPAQDTMTDNTPYFEWSQVGDARTYHIALYDSVDNPVPGYPATITQPQGEDRSYYQVVTPLDDGVYKWAIEALDDATNSSGFSEQRWFAVDRTPPPKPTLVSPANGGWWYNDRPFLDWDSIPDARTFIVSLYYFDGHVEVPGSPWTVVQPEGQDKSEFRVPEGYELPEDDFEWQVEALDYVDNTQGPCDEFSFSILYKYRDVGVTGILNPADVEYTGYDLKPKVKVQNLGEMSETFYVGVVIENTDHDTVFNRKEQIIGLSPTETRSYEFKSYSWTPTVAGHYLVTAFSKLGGEDNPDNDTMGPSAFSVAPHLDWPEGWVEVAPVPNTPTDKPVKRGAWLTLGPDADDTGNVIYATKGYKTTDFYKYYPFKDSWCSLAAVPDTEDGRVRPPKSGCRGVSDENEALYMTRGGNRIGFWSYDIASNSWTRKQDVPLGPYGKKVKYGNDMVYVFTEDTGWIYLLKGYKNEFYRYNTVSGEWDTTLEMVPYGGKLKYSKGSFLVYDGDNTIYAHQARYHSDMYHYMFKYSISGDSWTDTLKGMPYYCLEKGRDGKKKKSKDGACGAWYDGTMYALKGGNTQGLYKYFPEEDSWVQLRQDTMPQYTQTTGKKKRVKYGADIVSLGNTAFFALKGNKTYEFWRYVIRNEVLTAAPGPVRSGVMAGKVEVRTSEFEVFPNPIASGFATVRFALPKAGPATVAVYDVAGRVACRQTMMAGRTGSVNLDLRKLASGVYLVRLDADSYSTTQKLVVQK